MERRIILEGASNFRDLGGYQTTDGATTKWRTMFRSDTPAFLTPKDLDIVAGLGVQFACDLRYGEERITEPSQYKAHAQIEVLELGLNERPDDTFVDSFTVADDVAEHAQNFLISHYNDYPILYAHAYRAIFDRLIAGNRLVLHCTAGKDRAGTAAAVLLSALGVPRETVVEDYLLTNEYWDRGGRDLGDVDPVVMQAIFSAREEYLATAFATIEREFGNMDRYLVEHVGLDTKKRDALKEACLE